MAPARVAPCDLGSGPTRATLVVTPRLTPRPRCSCSRDGSGRLSTRSTSGAGVVGLPSSSGRITIRIRRIRVAVRSTKVRIEK